MGPAQPARNAPAAKLNAVQWVIGFVSGFAIGGALCWWAAWKIAIYVERKRIATELATTITKGVALSMADPVMQAWAAKEKQKRDLSKARPNGTRH